MSASAPASGILLCGDPLLDSIAFQSGVYAEGDFCLEPAVPAPLPGSGCDASAMASSSPRERRRGPRSSASSFRGVSMYKRTGRWEAHIWHTGKQLHLGSFRHVEDAARAYDKAAIKLRGWNAEMNFPSASYKDDTVLADNLDGLSSNEFVLWLRRTGKEADAEEDASPRKLARHASFESSIASSSVPGALDELERAESPPLLPSPMFGEMLSDMTGGWQR